MSLARDRFSRFNRLLLTMMLMLGWSGTGRPLRADAPPVPHSASHSQAADPTPEALKSFADQLDLMFPLLQEAHRQIPHDRFDPAAVIEQVGRDPLKLFEWVRDQTTWIGYQGSLRGAAGVLQDRLGNSLDRSVLLAELLHGTGQRVRLARATLSEEQAKSLLEKVRPLPRSASSDADAFDQNVASTVETLAASHHLDAAALKKAVDQASLVASRQVEETAQNSAEQTSSIMGLLGHSSGQTAEAGQARLVSAMRDHFWIQQFEAGRWVDMDLLLPDAARGKSLAPPASTIEWTQRDRVIPLDPKLYHEVELHVVAEQWKEGKLAEHPVLTYVLRPAQMNGAAVQFHQLALHSPKIFQAGSIEEFRANVNKETEWLPTLEIGETVVAQSSIDVYGNVNKSPSVDPTGGLASKGVARGFGGFGGALGGAAPAAPTGVLTAEWIEYVVRAPNEPPQTIRRELFDLIGPAARIASSKTRTLAEPKLDDAAVFNRGLALLGETQILIAGFTPAPEYVQYLYGKALLANIKPYSAILRRAADPSQKVMDEKLMQQLTAFPAELYAFALARMGWSSQHDDVYLDCPNIVSHHAGLRQNAQGELLNCSAMDIVANRVATRPGLGEKAFGVRVTQGIVDTNVELAMVAGCGQMLNAADVFARSAPEQWLVVRADNDAAWAGLKVSDDVRARVNAELAAAQVVIIPTQPPIIDGTPRMSYWRIDPATGQCLGVGENGWGQAMSEQTSLQIKVFMRTIQTGACVAFSVSKGSVAGGAICVLGGGFGLGGDLATTIGWTKMTGNLLSSFGILASTVGMFRSNVQHSHGG
ncbi:MAG TPA: hypothetical protein VH370_26960 [Humisphaera sp.]|jgi:hypothetical protein|nr:hypothetical protein [Humisphaera sp.]